MLLAGLLIVGFALPVAAMSSRTLALTAAAGALLLAAALAPPQAAPAITTAGVLSAGLIGGGILRLVLARRDQAQDREIRRRLPRELPQRHR